MTVDLDVHLSAIAAGDAQAFAAWLAGAEPSLRRSLRSFAAVVDTEAVLQESLLRVWQVAPRVQRDGRPDSLLRLARRITRNAAIDAVRRARLTLVEAEVLEKALHEDLDALGPSAVPDPFLRAAIEECRRLLPPKPAAALTARLEARGGVHDRDLAAGLDLKLNTFLKNVGRAKKLLKECLRGRGVVLEVP